MMMLCLSLSGSTDRILYSFPFHNILSFSSML
nr:MAG TPA: hypothetical protein [Caudoviricetes sp.]